MNKMREEFEAWCAERGYTLRPAETNCGVRIEGEYGHHKVQIAWEAWKASRAELCAWKSVFDERPNPDFDPVIICFNNGEIFESEVDEDGIYCNICGLEFSHWMPKSAIPNP